MCGYDRIFSDPHRSAVFVDLSKNAICTSIHAGFDTAPPLRHPTVLAPF